MLVKKVAVIGSGVMGASIAAHIANSNTEVLLFDIVPAGASPRNMLTEQAIEKSLNAEPAPFSHQNKASFVTACNLEDDLEKLADVDWIIEVIIENKEIKRALYQKIDQVRKPNSVISSNTSTIPLAHLTEGMSANFQQDFLITHFFNPPRYMRLLEIVTGPNTRLDAVQEITEFCDERLGKGIVNCKDTPGFIANRIGCFWLLVGVREAIKLGIAVTLADSVMSKPLGIPKTGVFGLMDLIGIDLMELIWGSFQKTLPADDAFIKLYQREDLITHMIKDGYIGRKGKGGFYRIENIDGKKTKQIKDLHSGKYLAEEKLVIESAQLKMGEIKKLVTANDIGGKYAWCVLAELFHYVTSLIPEISDDIAAVDEAMRLGFNWQYGPFELIDMLGDDQLSGAKWLVEKFESEGREVPKLLQAVGNNNFYKIENHIRSYFALSGAYNKIETSKEAWSLNSVRANSAPISNSDSAALYDIGDGVACLEINTKMKILTLDVFGFIEQIFPIISRDFTALVIGSDDNNFCAGADLKFFLKEINQQNWDSLKSFIKYGQQTMMLLKYAPFPVVSAVSGMALGGGCELLLHSSAVQAHIETNAGLVEVGVGLIPGWGGCKEMLYRSYKKNGLDGIKAAFSNILTKKVSKSAEYARDMFILGDNSAISMNKTRLLNDAKILALKLVTHHSAQETFVIADLPGGEIANMLDETLQTMKLDEHDQLIAGYLIEIFSAGRQDRTISEQELLTLEQNIFIDLLKTPITKERIEKMLG